MASLVLVAIAQVADLVTMVAMSTVAPIAAESNGLLRFAFDIGGPGAAVIVKGAFILALLALVDFLSVVDARWVRVGIPALGIGTGLAGTAANVTTLLLTLLHHP